MFEFRPLAQQDLELVGHWRTQPMVTRFMFTNFRYDPERQKQWFDKVKRDPRRQYWIVSYERPIGVISLSNINHIHHWSHYEFYIGELDYWNMGGFVCSMFYNFIFNQSPLKLNKLIAEVMHDNLRARKLHTYHGYREVGWFKNHIFKDGRYHDVVIYELLKFDWLKNAEKFSSFRGVWHD